ncbi:MAG: DUF4965 domain-containing protein [Planctomycetaceae bacterium]|jgi:hypothetical protein|nr:DUF4965 domain-containing protein [Planctomycetaceae bacterium]
MTLIQHCVLRFFAAIFMVCGTVNLFANLFAAEISAPPKLRAPAYPLIAHDPYFSVWSFADKLTDVTTTHWTGKLQPISGTITIDGDKPLRFIGTEPMGTERLGTEPIGAEPKSLDAMPQVDVTVFPTRTVYHFATEKVKLMLTFLTPSLPDDIDLLSRPLTFLQFDLVGLDNAPHRVALRLAVDPVIAVNTPEQEVVCETVKVSGLNVLRVGSSEQRVLGKKGDDLRIDWGHFYLATKNNQNVKLHLTPRSNSDHSQNHSGNSQNQPLAAKNAPLLTAEIEAEIAQNGRFEYGAVLAYDDVKSIRYFGKELLPYWKRNGATITDLLTHGFENGTKIRQRCEQFDKELIDNLTQTGGEKYAQLCSLVYRQTWAANKIAAAPDKRPYMFSKENFSNGCIGTIDVLYPHTPFLLFFSPALLKGSLVPVLNYAESEFWKYDYAPHDIGTYPFATGQVYGMNGGHGNRMPVEESGNMLIIVAALAKVEGNADFAEHYWELLTRWADYLVREGYDPENQLCSADMFGHLAHVTNLSLKAIIGIAAYARLCEQLGKTEAAQKYRRIAEDYAKKWLKDAQDEGRTRLAFDKAGTWSMKHNLIWDSILETNLFPATLAEQEIAWYKKVQNKYGLPVDSRTDNSLIDWALWSITPTKSKADFDELFNPIYNYVNETPSRVPLSDWFITTNAKRRGFQARSVVGGVYIKMLTNKTVWEKSVQQAENVTDFPSSYPARITRTEIIPTARTLQTEWKYTLESPSANNSGNDSGKDSGKDSGNDSNNDFNNWTKPDFDASAWKSGKNGFGSNHLPNNPPVGTTWNTKQIWLRKEFELTKIPDGEIFLYVYYDEDPEIWINGVFAAKAKGYTTNYVTLEITPEAKKTLKIGKNIIAIKASQTYGGQYIDAGLVKESPIASTK